MEKNKKESIKHFVVLGASILISSAALYAIFKVTGVSDPVAWAIIGACSYNSFRKDLFKNIAAIREDEKENVRELFNAISNLNNGEINKNDFFKIVNKKEIKHIMKKLNIAEMNFEKLNQSESKKESTIKDKTIDFFMG